MSSLLNVSNGSSKLEEYGLNDIDVLAENKEQKWFTRAHVRKFLGLKHIVTSMEGLDKCEMLTKQELVPTCRAAGWSGPKDQQNKTDKFLSKKSIQYVISGSRKFTYNLGILAKALGMNIHENKWLFKEQETILLNIMAAFGGEKMCTQYSVDGYRIDLYFPGWKIAVECDEFRHRERDIEYEVKRQRYIEEKLGCKFIRYNPDAKGFNLFKVINRIFLAIQT